MLTEKATAKFSFVYLLLIVHFLKSCTSTTTTTTTIEVKLGQGLVSGKIEKTFLNSQTYFSFKGIPYAEPPTGPLRFKPPKPSEGWADLYKAYDDKPTCVQFSFKRRNGEKIGISGSEDCLHLSVFTPNLEGSRAVIVFDYHDSYQTGFNGTKTYSPEFLPEEDVVIVSISHRLGLLGYLTTEDEVIPANNGLRDYILALEWIKNNIKHFGGDPDRVTLMGCKGGGALANVLLYSKAAKGLFNAVTIQGGTAHESLYFPKKPREFAYKLGNILGIGANESSNLLKELQNVDFTALLTKSGEVVNPEEFLDYQISVYPFSPVIEKEGPESIITSLPEDGKIFNDVPVLIGFNSREGLDLISDILFDTRILTELGQEMMVHLPIRTNFRFDRNDSSFEDYKEEILKFYLKGKQLKYYNILDYAVYVADIVENYSLNIAARKLSRELESPTYYYMFDFNGLLNENMIYLSKNTRGGTNNWGASVGDEICYLHLCSRIRDNYLEIKSLVSQQNEFKLVRKMIRLWANFAKTGNPTPQAEDDFLKNFIWKPIDKKSENLPYAHITKRIKMLENPLEKRDIFWNNLLDKYSKLAVNGVVRKIEAHDEL